MIKEKGFLEKFLRLYFIPLTILSEKRIAKKRNAKGEDCHVLEKGKEVTRTSSGTYNDSPDGRSAIKSCGRN